MMMKKKQPTTAPITPVLLPLLPLMASFSVAGVVASSVSS